MNRELDRQIRERAQNRCEYCHLPQACSPFKLTIDHIRARQHQGLTTADNLALACGRCNRKKGPNLSGADSRSGHIVQLFNPRLQQWTDHFRWRGPRLVGLTDVGRATIQVLGLNLEDRLELRRELMITGEFPRDFK